MGKLGIHLDITLDVKYWETFVRLFYLNDTEDFCEILGVLQSFFSEYLIIDYRFLVNFRREVKSSFRILLHIGLRHNSTIGLIINIVSNNIITDIPAKELILQVILSIIGRIDKSLIPSLETSLNDPSVIVLDIKEVKGYSAFSLGTVLTC